MFVRNCWYMIDWSKNFDTEGGITALTLLEEELVFYRQTDGTLVAMEDRCCHSLAPLSTGLVEGDDLRCMYHGLKFGPDGACNEIPQQPGATIPQNLCVKTYPVIEKHDAAWIWMGNPALTNPNTIPDISGSGKYKWAMIPEQLEINANYALLNDNLLDLSHVSYVHRNSFGVGDEATNRAFAESTVVNTKFENGMRVGRWIANNTAPPYVKDLIGLDKVDFYTGYDFLVPGVFLLNQRCYPLGTFERCGQDLSNEESVFAEFSCQTITPVTEGSLRYFFALGPWEKHAQLKELYLEIGFTAFGEDKVMLESQQKVIDRSSDKRLRNLSMDQASVSFRKLMSTLMQAETEQSN